MRRERDEARRRAMTLLAERESLVEAQQEERIARLKVEEELAELTVAIATLSKNSEDYWEAKFSNNRTKLEEDQSELSKLNELFAEKESYSKLQTLQLIEKEELGANIEMLAGAGETTLEQVFEYYWRRAQRRGKSCLKQRVLCKKRSIHHMWLPKKQR